VCSRQRIPSDSDSTRWTELNKNKVLKLLLLLFINIFFFPDYFTNDHILQLMFMLFWVKLTRYWKNKLYYLKYQDLFFPFFKAFFFIFSNNLFSKSVIVKNVLNYFITGAFCLLFFSSNVNMYLFWLSMSLTFEKKIKINIWLSMALIKS